jgi:ATP-grasp domain, R2K clade family 2
MPTLVLPPRFTPDTIAVGNAAHAAGWSVERFTSWRLPEGWRAEDVALYGEPLFASVVADQLGLVLLEPPFNWLTTLHEKYRKRNVRFTILGEARKLGQHAFVKPADDKCFLAGVFQSGATLPSADILSGATPVLVAEPVKWQVEFRCFVLEREMVTLSPYLRDGELAQSPEGQWDDERTEKAREFAQGVLSDGSVSLPPAVVMDVGVIEGRGWAIIEANAAWGSGIYGCDPAAVLRVVRRACLQRGQVAATDSRWVVEREAG